MGEMTHKGNKDWGWRGAVVNTEVLVTNRDMNIE